MRTVSLNTKLFVLTFLFCALSDGQSVNESDFTQWIPFVDAFPIFLTNFVPSNQGLENWANQTLGIPFDEILRYHFVPYFLSKDQLLNDFVINDTVASSVNNGTIFLRFNRYIINGKERVYVTGKRSPLLQSFWAEIIFNNSEGSESYFGIDNVLLPPTAEDQKTILEEILTNPRTTILASILRQLLDENCTEILSLGQFVVCDCQLAHTLFAPTDDALNALPPGVLDVLMSDRAQMKYFIKYHLINTTFFSIGISNGASLRTLAGPALNFVRGSPLSTGAFEIQLDPTTLVNVTTRDLHRENGVIHLIDGVLTTPETCLEPRNDGGKKLPSSSFWCTQFKTALQPRYYKSSVFTPTQLLGFVRWVSRNSDFFKGYTTLSQAKSTVCGSTSLESETYTLWLNAASGNLFLETNIADFCITTQPKTYYKKTSYKKDCRRYTYRKVVVPAPVLTNQTIGEILTLADAALFSKSRTLRNANLTRISEVLTRQAPGAGGCANTCGPSGGAAYLVAAIMGTNSLFFDDVQAVSSGIGISAIVGISVAATSVGCVALVALVLIVFRERIAGVLDEK